MNRKQNIIRLAHELIHAAERDQWDTVKTKANFINFFLNESNQTTTEVKQEPKQP